jgi:sodium transport system ATP-binding protein
MEEAQYLCDRINMLYQGRIIAEGTPGELMERTGTTNLRETFRALIKETEAEHE